MKKILLVMLFIVSSSLIAVTQKGKSKGPRPCPKGTECVKGWTCDAKKKVCVRKPAGKKGKPASKNPKRPIKPVTTKNK